MNKRAEKVEVVVEELRDSAPSADGSTVVLDTGSRVDGTFHDTAIEVQQGDAPALAVALLNAESEDPHTDPEDKPVLKCLGAGVVHGLNDSRVRFHLQFDSGQVLPIEMSREAAVALCRGLFQHTGAAAGFQPTDWGLPPSVGR